MNAGTGKILIARRFRLAIPKRLLFDLGGGQFGDALEAHHGVAQVGDGSVAVLEIEAFEEFLRIVGAHPFDGSRMESGDRL